MPGHSDDRIDDFTRPESSPPTSDRARAWLEWFGLGRLVTSAIATVIVCGGAYWLIRTPPPSTEAALPPAASSEAPLATLPVAISEPERLDDVADRDDGPLVVHVAGAVEQPGVYELVAGSRVSDAVAAAGGAIGDAQVDALNLAAPLADGSRIYVPAPGEDVVMQPLVIAETAGADEPSGPVDANRASAEQLETLPGVGPATAAAIVAERTRNGPFASVADLERVPGIGPSKLAALEGLVTT